MAQGAWPVLVDEFVDALCGRAGAAAPRPPRRRLAAASAHAGASANSLDGYSADAEADEDAAAAAAAPHLLGRAPCAGSKRRVPSVSSLEQFGASLNSSGTMMMTQHADVDGIAERLARIQASPPKRRKSGARGGCGMGAPAEAAQGRAAVVEAAAPLCWPPARAAEAMDGD